MFHAGDFVIPVRPESKLDREQFPYWTARYDEFVGKVGMVIYVHSNTNVTVSFGGTDERLCFRQNWLRNGENAISR